MNKDQLEILLSIVFDACVGTFSHYRLSECRWMTWTVGESQYMTKPTAGKRVTHAGRVVNKHMVGKWRGLVHQLSLLCSHCRLQTPLGCMGLYSSKQGAVLIDREKKVRKLDALAHVMAQSIGEGDRVARMSLWDYLEENNFFA